MRRVWAGCVVLLNALAVLSGSTAQTHPAGWMFSVFFILSNCWRWGMSWSSGRRSWRRAPRTISRWRTRFSPCRRASRTSTPPQALWWAHLNTFIWIQMYKEGYNSGIALHLSQDWSVLLPLFPFFNGGIPRVKLQIETTQNLRSFAACH